MSQPRVPKSSPKGLYIMFSNVIHQAGPLNPPHVPAPCPQVNVIHHAGPLDQPHVPAPCPQVKP